MRGIIAIGLASLLSFTAPLSAQEAVLPVHAPPLGGGPGGFGGGNGGAGGLLDQVGAGGSGSAGPSLDVGDIVCPLAVAGIVAGVVLGVTAPNTVHPAPPVVPVSPGANNPSDLVR